MMIPSFGSFWLWILVKNHILLLLFDSSRWNPYKGVDSVKSITQDVHSAKALHLDNTLNTNLNKLRFLSVTIIVHHLYTVNRNAIVLLILHQKYYGVKLLYAYGSYEVPLIYLIILSHHFCTYQRIFGFCLQDQVMSW